MTIEGLTPEPPDSADGDAITAALIFAVDPVGIGGVLVRARAGPCRDRWLAFLRSILPAGAPFRRMPVSIAESRLLGGLDLAATLRAGRPVAERGLLAEISGGVLVLPMAERLAPLTAAHLAAALDGHVHLERDGMSARVDTHFGIVALDEGVDDERPPATLVERLALTIDLDVIGWIDEPERAGDPAAIRRARTLLPRVQLDDAFLVALCTAAMRLGVGSLRAPLIALRVARAAAALAGRRTVVADDVTLAARLVLAPRATIVPVDTPEPPRPAAEAAPSGAEPAESGDEDARSSTGALDDLVLASAKAAIPERLLADLTLAGAERARATSLGRAGMARLTCGGGRPAGTGRGQPRAGARLNLIETLRAAAPWQPLRRAEAQRSRPSRPRLIEVRVDDFRITRFKQRTQTVTVFVVDASGSSAFNRLAEVKGAIELLLAECYLRRDQVALIAFRGRQAELVLPPTRSLVRAKRSLAALPGGGGTPLAAALDSATALGAALRRKGQTPVLILMTDGQANVARDGSAGRARAEEDALAAARHLRLARLSAMVIDTSPRARPPAARIAAAMGAPYVPLPYADSIALSQTVLAAGAR